VIDQVTQDCRQRIMELEEELDENNRTVQEEVKGF
jgi:hypothetical protein